jgi:ATP-dependent exoDNAse (exonuclease V) alpha subunit
MYHLTARVAWHDARWDGTVCCDPSGNPYCLALDRIREGRNDEAEDAVAGQPWCDLKVEELPACIAESAAFMNPHEWTRRFSHPYADLATAKATHEHLATKEVILPPYSTFAVPFNWMLRSEQDAIEDKLPEPLPPEEDGPFPKSPWVFTRARQEALLEHVFGRLVPEKSLVFFYCKEGQPLGDKYARLVVGVGTIQSMSDVLYYDAPEGKPTYPLWDRLYRHSIRPDGIEGFLIPYHDYLEPTGNREEDERRLALLEEIAVAPDPDQMRTFSYAAELASSDTTLSVLIRCLDVVRTIRQHGIAKGPWEAREEWLNEQIAAVWKDRGAFPGLGPALEALGMRLGTALSHELVSAGHVGPDEDPWNVVDSLLTGQSSLSLPQYEADLRAISSTWNGLSEERRTLLRLLSRFALTCDQAKRWFDSAKRDKATRISVSDCQILNNPYLICEMDLGDEGDRPVAMGTLDRGLMPESTLAVCHPVPEPMCVTAPNDARRVRAALVSVLRQAALDGDSLLNTTDALQRVAKLDLERTCLVGSDWIAGNAEALEGAVNVLEIPDKEGSKSALQLSELRNRERRLSRILEKRAAKSMPPIDVDWRQLLRAAIEDSGGTFDPENPRHAEALQEQSEALETIISRRLTVLVGRAGTGKTSVLGALMLCKQIQKDGILLLAPTGKARVRLGKAANAEALTIAQFLHRLGRYDGARQRSLFNGPETHRKEKTVVIDECSMLTMDDLAAVMEALDLAHVERLILVGDANQLPPIGVGRPLADLVCFLESKASEAEDGASLGDALARLTVEVRSAVAHEQSDTLRLASWFTRESQPIDADRVLSELELGGDFNDLELRFWETPEELQEELAEAFTKHLGLAHSRDIPGFDASLGLTEKGWVPFKDPSGSENWQILSPVRMRSYGVYSLNRWIQGKFRAKGLRDASGWGASLGDERIVAKDKVIQTLNQTRNGWHWSEKKKIRELVANGEVGLVSKVKSNLKVAFAGRPDRSFDYWSSQFGDGAAPLSLAYALTVHKAQGSEFKKVFVVIPALCRLLSRELIYTALTRSREHMVLLIEGADASALFDLSKPERSETAKRNTNLFDPVVRDAGEELPYAEHLIHRTEKGHLVRSKSELVIANMLFREGIEYEYERPCEGTTEPGKLRPDFSFIAPDGDLVLWEHLGMMNREDYRRGWEWKRNWYHMNGFVDGETLFITEDDSRGGLNSEELRIIAQAVRERCE